MLSRLLASRQRPYIPHRNKQETISIDLSGSRLTFRLPPHACHDSFAYFNLHPPQQVNVFDDSAYGDDSEFEDRKREGVATQQLMQRSWELFGPIWRGRPIGTVDFVLTLNRHDFLPENMSCFNPEHFEQVLMRFLYCFGPCNPDGRKQKAPVNWQARKIGGAAAYFFERHQHFSARSLEECPFYPTHFSSYLMLPLTERHFIRMSFRYLGYAPVEPCLLAMNTVRDGVCNSAALELSKDAKSRLKGAEQQWPQAKASEKRDIEPWIYPEWKYCSDHPGGILITKPGSPPPAWQA